MSYIRDNYKLQNRKKKSSFPGDQVSILFPHFRKLSNHKKLSILFFEYYPKSLSLGQDD